MSGKPLKLGMVGAIKDKSMDELDTMITQWFRDPKLVF